MKGKLFEHFNRHLIVKDMMFHFAQMERVTEENDLGVRAKQEKWYGNKL